MTIDRMLEKAARTIDGILQQARDTSALQMIESGMDEADAMDLLDWIDTANREHRAAALVQIRERLEAELAPDIARLHYPR